MCEYRLRLIRLQNSVQRLEDIAKVGGGLDFNGFIDATAKVSEIIKELISDVAIMSRAEGSRRSQLGGLSKPVPKLRVLKDSYLVIRSGSAALSRSPKQGLRLLICRTRADGSRHRCRRIMPRRSWRNGGRSQGSSMARGSNNYAGTNPLHHKPRQA